MRSFILTALILLTTYAVSAQSPTLVGTVTRGGSPVAGATVTVTDQSATKQQFTYQTGADGRFIFNVPSGRYVISATNGSGATAVGSVSKTIDVGRSEITVDLDLVLSGAVSESVNISADQIQPIDEVSKTVNVIGGQEMRERADFTLVDSLRSMPGFRVQQLGGFGRTASIKTRGLRNQDTAVLIDGVRLRDAAAITGDASPFLSDLTLTSVSRVEVLRGSGSSLYGTNAIGGTVNFITPEARKGWHGQVSANAGGLGFGRFRGNTSYASDSGKYGFNLGVSRTAYTKGIDGEDNASNTNFQPRFDLRPTDRTHISTRFFFSDASVRLNSSPDTLGTFPATNTGIIDAQEGVNFIADANDPDSIQKSRFLSGVFSITHILTDNLSINGYYSGLKTRRRNDNDIQGVGFQSASTSFNKGLIHTANAGVTWTPKYHTLKAGYEFEHEKYANDNFTPTGTTDNFVKAFQSSNTFFVQDVVGLFGGRLQLAGGARAQWFDLKTPEFSLSNSLFPNSTALEPEAAYTFDGAASYYFRSTGTKLRAHVGNGYRVPSLYERFGSYYSTWPSPGFVALGDPTLKPEKTIAFDAGVEQVAFSNKARFSATYFYTQLTDIIGYGNVAQPDPNGRFGGYLNTKGGIARGGEFSVDVSATSSTDIFASYTYTNSIQRQTQVAGSGVIRTLGIPENQFTLVATQRFKQFWVNFDLLVSSSYLGVLFQSGPPYGSYVFRFDGNRRGDLTGGYTFKLKDGTYDLRLYGTIENVFDNEYFENGFRTPGRNGRVGVSFGF